MMRVFSLSWVAALALSLFLLPIAGRAEDAWCRQCGDWVDRDVARNGNTCPVCGTAVFCQDCGGIYVAAELCPHKEKRCEVCGEWYKGMGLHADCRKLKCKNCGKAFDKPADGTLPLLCDECRDPGKELVPCDRCGRSFEVSSGNPVPSLCPECAGVSPVVFFVKDHAWAIGASLIGVIVLIVVLLSVRSGRRAASLFIFVKGKPQGIELIPDELVCSDQSLDSGGTAEGRPAMLKRDGNWKPAFVKRIIGGGMREESRRPALEFEANILRRLSGTGAAPELLVDVTDSTTEGGEKWTYFTMTVAQGSPWPEYGGYGKETRHALFALCEALASIHEKGIGHHDLKPMNIFYKPNTRQVTLLDFGSAIDHSGDLVNPLGNTYPKTLPWVAPDGDGRRLADLSIKSDVYVYGLIFCEAILGCIHTQTLAARKSPTKEEDRAWIREKLSEKLSPEMADAVIDGLLAPDAVRRMSMSAFHELLVKEWEVA